MRARNRLMGLLSSLVLVSAMAGCGDDVAQQVACNTSEDCIAESAAWFEDASAENLPVCCNHLCIIQNASGCLSGERYLNASMEAVGGCVPEPLCAEAPTEDAGGDAAQ